MRKKLSSISTTIGALQNSKKTFKISSNSNWKIEFDQTWIKADIYEGTGNADIILISEENPRDTVRNVKITVNGEGLYSQFFIVAQDSADPAILLMVDSLTISDLIDSEATIDLKSNCNYKYESDQTWLGFNDNWRIDTRVVLKMLEDNMSNTPRVAIVTLSSTGVLSKRVVVTQEA